jgi:hypothetical protein
MLCLFAKDRVEVHIIALNGFYVASKLEHNRIDSRPEIVLCLQNSDPANS